MPVSPDSEAPQIETIDPLTAQKAMRLSMVSGSVAGVFFAGTTGAIINGFALYLNADNFHIGLLGAIPLFAFSAQILGAFTTEAVGDRKLVWTITCGLQRILWLPILLIPHLFGWTESSTQLKILLCLVLVASLMGAAATPAWMSWMADVVPHRQSGRFWGPRGALMMLVVFGGGIPFSIIMDRFEQYSVAGYTIVFAIAVVFGVADVVIHQKIKHPTMMRSASRHDFGRLFFKPFKNPEFRQFLLLTCSWNFAVQLFVPFISVYFLRDLKMTFLQISLLNTSFAVSILIFSRFWGYIIDHFGKRPVIELLLALKFTVPAAYLFTHPGMIWPVLIPIYIFDGFLVAGLNPAFQAASLSYSPREDKSIFIAMYQALMGLVSAIGPVMAGYFMQQMPNFRLDWGPFHWRVIHLAFLSSVIVRLFIWPLGRRLSEPGAASAMDVLRTFMDGNPFRTIRHLHVLDMSSDAEQRMKSAQALRRRPGAMAVESLLEALHDPDREVRSAAALALGGINSPESIQALLHALRSPELDVQQQAARSLGVIGTPECIQALIDMLMTSEDTTLRNHVARVLGQTHSHEAVVPLLSLFRNEQGSGVLASAAEALSRLGEIRALRTILPQMRQIEEPVIRAQMAVAVANLLGEEGEFYTVLAEEKRVPGLAVSRLQAALSEDLRALKSAGHSNGCADHLGQIRLTHLGANYEETCRQCRMLCQHLFGMATHEEGNPEETEFIDQMRLFILVQPKLGIQMWFLLVMGSQEWISQGPVGMELALLSQYALAKVSGTLRHQPELLEISEA